MLMNHPIQFEQKAREWAIMHADAPKMTSWSKSAPSQSAVPIKPKTSGSKEEEARKQALRYVPHFLPPPVANLARYQGYNKDLIDRFVNMGFDIDRVVDAFNYVNIDRNNGEDYQLEEAYMGDITARLLGEP